ncbi:MAG TPA: DMT family transporter [Hyphomicrobiales bacterium]|nr:DMT family transporter [Hyphomicrobiales bacterium]
MLQSNAEAPRPTIIGIGLPEAALIVVTMIWGGTFIVVQNALTVTGPFFFVGMRFGTAALMMALFSARSLPELTWGELRAGGLIGVAIAAGYSLQTIGLLTVLSSESAFITALYVPIVPLLQWAIIRRRPRLSSWAGIAIAFTGLVLITMPASGAVALSSGAALTLLCAVAFSFEITLIGFIAGTVDARRVSVVQLAAASLLAFAAMILAGESVPPFTWLLFFSVAGMALASTLIQYAMNWAQRTVSPTKATVIYAGEPVWAGIFGRLAGELLTGRAILGGILIVVAVIVSQWRSHSEESRETDNL